MMEMNVLYGLRIRSWNKFERPDGLALSLNFANTLAGRIGVSGGGLADADGDEPESKPEAPSLLPALYPRPHERFNCVLYSGMEPLDVRMVRFGRLVILAGTPPTSRESLVKL
jgi:hypothetical protein